MLLRACPVSPTRPQHTPQEVNIINLDLGIPLANKNYGWPCYEGPELQQLYSGQNMPPCLALQAAGNVVMPFFFYKNPDVPQPNGNHGSISAVGGWGDRLYIGDMTRGLIWSVNAQGGDLTLVMTETYAVGLFPSPVGLLVLDYNAGTIAPLDTGADVGAAGVAPPPPPPPPFVDVIPQQATWQPGGGALTYGQQTNIAGREGANTEWGVSLLYGCAADASCNQATLVVPAGPAPKIITVPAPPIEGTLEIYCHEWTFAGL